MTSIEYEFKEMAERIQRASADQLKTVLTTILTRMREIDEDICPSIWGGIGDGSSPTGQDYNDLWDALIDEIMSLS